ncbi:MAG: LacI family DNA-binding transcriptional regulator [Planctomycetota bacterium]
MPSTPSETATTVKRPRRVTLSMVAKEVGVGVTTVSDILNRGIASRYSPDMQRRVQEAVDRLGYTPHRGAQMMKRSRSGVVGLLLTRDFSNPFWARFADETEKALRSRGYLLHLGVCDGDPDTEAAHMQRLLSEQIEGLIIGPIYEDKDLDTHRNIMRGQVPTVVYGGDVGETDVVAADNAANGRLMGEHLLGLGHTRIAALFDPSSDEVAFERNTFGGLSAALINAGHRLSPEWLVRQPDTGKSQDAYETAGRFAARWKATPPDERPTAVACHNDQFAIAALCAFAEAGIRVPYDLSLVGHDNLPESRFAIPPLTTIDIDAPGLIAATVDLLAQRIANPKHPRQSVSQAGRLVVRRSAFPVGSASPPA